MTIAYGTNISKPTHRIVQRNRYRQKFPPSDCRGGYPTPQPIDRPIGIINTRYAIVQIVAGTQRTSMLTDRDHEAKQSSTHTVPDKLQGRQLTHLYVVIGDPSPFVDAQKSFAK